MNPHTPIFIKIARDSNLRYLPLVYLLPEKIITKCSTLRNLPRKPREVMYDKQMLEIVKSDQFLNEISDAVAALTFPHFGFGGWQDEFFAHMVKTFPDIERGESASITGRRHIPTRVFKQAVRLTKQATAIQAALDGINPINAGKKKNEVLVLLQKFFPNMERFESQVRQYKKEIDYLEKENAALAKKAAANEKDGIGRQMETAKLQIEYRNLRQFVESLPDEIKQQAKTQQKSQQQER